MILGCWLYSIYSKWEWFTHDNITSYSWQYSMSWRDYSTLCLESLFDNFTPILSQSNIISSPIMIISLAIAENIAGASVTIVCFVLNHYLITSLPFWVDRILSIPQSASLIDAITTCNWKMKREFSSVIILGFSLDRVKHSLVISLPLTENIWQIWFWNYIGFAP
jgi:hypothetical protein